MTYFVSADIHGFYTIWYDELIKAGFDINNPEHKIILCGDMFDRGDEPQKIIDFILSNPDKFILIRGNHEDLIQDMILRGYPYGYDESNGTYGTMISLANGDKSRDFRGVARSSGLYSVLDMCIPYYETSHYIFVHSWIPTDGNYPIENWRDCHYREWNEARWCNPVVKYLLSLHDKEKTIVSGHWHVSAYHKAVNPDKYPKEFGPLANFEPFISKEVIAIDACTALTHRVHVIVIND